MSEANYGNEYWSEIKGLFGQILDDPLKYEVEQKFFSVVRTDSFAWGGIRGHEGVGRYDNVELSRESRRVRAVGLTAVRHRMAISVGLGDIVGVTNLHINLPKRRIDRVDNVVLSSSVLAGDEQMDHLFSRARAIDESHAVAEPRDEHYDLLMAEAQRGAIIRRRFDS
jgi:hypothetical protein